MAKKKAEPPKPRRARKPATWQQRIKGKAAPAPAAAAATARPVITVPDDLEDAANRLCAAAQRAKVIEGIERDAKKTLLPVLRRETWRQWLAARRRLDNPQFQTPAARGILVVQLPDAAKVPFDAESPVTMEEHLDQAGVPPAVVDALKGEFLEEEVYELVSLTDLAKTRPDLVDRLMGAVLKAFTADELGLVVREATHVALCEGFWDRAIGHAAGLAGAEDRIAALDALIGAMAGKIFPSQMSFDADADALLSAARG